MREIKFRGRRKDNGEWVYGNLVDRERPFIVGRMIESNEEYCNLDWWQPVQPETVGQFTGLHDIGNREIWEGDVIEWFQSLVADGKQEGKLVREEVKFDPEGLYRVYCLKSNCNIKVLGNIYENKELLK